MSDKKPRRSQVLMLAAVAIFLGATMMLAVGVVIFSGRKIGRQSAEALAAFNTAEAGLELGKARLLTDWSWSRPRGPLCGDAAVAYCSYENQVDRTLISSNPAIGEEVIELSSHGWASNAHKVISVRLRRVSPPQPPQIVIPATLDLTPDGQMNWIENELLLYFVFNPVNHYGWLSGNNRHMEPHWCNTQPHPETMTRVCNCAGYTNFAITHSHTNVSCSDNSNVFLNPSGVWEWHACGGHWNRQHNIRCSNPLPRCNNNRDDDGDGFIDFDGFDLNRDGDVTDPGDRLLDPDCTDADDEDERGALLPPGPPELLPGTWRID